MVDSEAQKLRLAIRKKLREYIWVNEYEVDEQVDKENIAYSIVWRSSGNDLRLSVRCFREDQKREVFNALKKIKPVWFHIISHETCKVVYASLKEEIEL